MPDKEAILEYLKLAIEAAKRDDWDEFFNEFFSACYSAIHEVLDEEVDAEVEE